MKNRKPLIISLIVAAAVLLAAGITALIILLNREEPDPPEVLPPTVAQTVYFLKDGASGYSIAYSNFGVEHESYADDLRTKLAVDFSCRLPRYEYSASTAELEILIGLTDRALSSELKAAVDAANTAGDSLAWGYAYKDGKLAFYANGEAALDYGGWDAFLAAIVHSDGVYCQDDLWVIGVKTQAEYQEELEEERREQERLETEARNKELQRLRAGISKFTAKSFGTLANFPATYGQLKLVPTEAHPKIWVTAETLPTLRENIKSAESLANYEKVKELADNSIKGDGVLTERPENAPSDWTNYSTDALSRIESLAFMYLVTDDDLYGYAAILRAFNFMDTVVFSAREQDAYVSNNRAGAAFYIFAEVYDWCYDLFMPKQRTNFVTACCNVLASLMEVGYPPTSLGAVVGHGTGLQILRNWVAFAVATSDDFPQIYHNVMGRVLNEYVEAPNWYYAAGVHHQGSSYGTDKVFSQVFSEMLMLTATGEKIYSVDFEPTIMSFIERLRPDGEPIRVGDDYASSDSDPNTDGSYTFYKSSVVAFLGATYCKNPAAKAWYKEWSNGYETSWSQAYELTPVFFLLHNDPTVKSDDASKFALELVKYTSYPSTGLTVRSAWNDEAAWLTFTNMEEAYAANHDHKDAGTFQIYYKGILAPDAGAYQYGYKQGFGDQAYGSLYDFAYVKQTVSKNGLLVYNPSYENLKLTPHEYGTIWDGETEAWLNSTKEFYFDNATGKWLYNAKSGGTGKWYYTGGQTTQGTANSEPSSLSQWLSKDTSNQTTILGKSQKTVNGEVVYAYISGDITNAYDAETVDLVTRSTMSLATGDDDHPLVFLVYDRIISDSADYKKSFVLHTMNEPQFGADAVIDAPEEYIPAQDPTERPEVRDEYTYVTNANSFYYTNVNGAAGDYESDIADDKYNGQLTTTTLLPENPQYAYIGGDGHRFWVGNMNAGQEGDMTSSVASELGWGRVEISPSVASTDTSFLNVMYVSDAGNTEYIPAELITTATHEGAATFNSIVLFAKASDGVAEEISFTAKGEGEMACYIGGLAEGIWSVKVGNNEPEAIMVNKDEGMLTFTANAGDEVTVTPTFEKLKLVLNGGEMTEYIPGAYYPDSDFTVPTTVVRYSYDFRGWYESPDFSGEPVKVIPEGTTGEITLYAKWEKVFGVITYHLNGGTINGEYPTENRVGEKIILPSDVTKTQSEFSGWYANPDYYGIPIDHIPAQDLYDYNLYAKFDGPVYFSEGSSATGMYPIEAERFGDLVNADKSKSFTVRIDTRDKDNKGWENGNAGWTGSASLRLFNSLTTVENEERHELVLINFLNDRMVTGVTNEPLMIMNSGDTVDIVVDCINKTLTYYVNGKFVIEEDVPNGKLASNLKFYNCPEAGFDASVYKQRENYKGPIQLVGNQNRVLAWDAFSIFVGKEIAEGADNYKKLELYTDGGESVDHIPTVYYEGEATPLPDNMTKFGFEFCGWYESPDFSGEPVTEIPAEATGVMRYYAKWEKVFGIITYYKNGGTFTSAYPIENHDGEEVPLNAVVERAGAEFLGWYTTPSFDEGTKIETIPAAGMEDYSLYAKFEGAVYYSKNQNRTDLYPMMDVLFGDMLIANNGKFTLHIDTASTGNTLWDDGDAGWTGASSIRMFNSMVPIAGGDTYEFRIINFKQQKMVTCSWDVELMEMNSGDTVDVIVDMIEGTLTYYVNGVFKVTENITAGKIAPDLKLYNCASAGVNTEEYKKNGNLSGPVQLVGNAARSFAWDEFAVYMGEVLPEG